MNKNYFALWALLAAAFAAIILLSAFSPITIGSYEVRNSGIVDFLTKSNATDSTAVDSSDPMLAVADSLAKNAAPEPAPIDTTAKTILFIGDSMLEGLSPRLAAYAKHNGHKLYSVIWYSSTSEVWGRSGKLKGYIERVNPDFVFVCLGANELFVKDIITKRDKYVKTLIAEIDSLPYLWIGPPNWKPDTGINKLIAANTGRGQFFLSDGMQFDRAKDGAHPTRKSAVKWMDSVVRWMPANSPNPFRLEIPPMEKASATRIFTHQPNEK